MLTITEYSVELVKDPFGILTGERYEFLLDIAVDEEDELYSEQGVYIRAIYGITPEQEGIIKYELYERNSRKYLDFELEDDELAELEVFCKNHLT
ncbi:hypothetical protein J2Z32_000649 [Paenibacillus turicensis]|uniref:Pullulanase n=1 Tax=Paenibacillus turicensis TaxID=160487 RepID=A0ABS4FN74_9BACL|nr:DUF6509 family protein [Paenibacillus turicensis]MBP1904032.1 hypothetical protein [Paenibacillus turicensis]